MAMRVGGIAASRRRRSGAAAVEMAFSLLPLLIMMFGIFEFGRFVMDRQLMDNAVRAACRYALANNTQTSPNLLSNSGAWNTSVEGIVNQMLGGRQSDFVTPPTIANGQITVTGLHYNTATQAWDAISQANIATLAAGDRITVSVTASYKFILVPFLPVQSTVPINSQVTMLCEGGT
jgi:Flp pilus assembly protein TadG